MSKEIPTETTLHLKVPTEWYEALRRMAARCEGTIHQQAKLAVREKLERVGAIAGCAGRY